MSGVSSAHSEASPPVAGEQTLPRGTERLFDLGAEHYLIIDRTGTITFANARVTQFLTSTQRGLIGRCFFDYCTEFGESELANMWPSPPALTRGHLEVEVRCRDGAQRLLSWNYEISAVDGLAYLAGRDLTEFERRQRLLSETQRIALVGGWEFDVQTKESYWTRETYSIFDTNPQEFDLTFETAMSMVAPEYADKVRDEMQLALATGIMRPLEFEIITRMNRRLWVRATGRVIFKDGTAKKVYGALQNIDRWKRDQLQRERSEQRLQAVLFNSLEGVSLCNADGVAMSLIPDVDMPTDSLVDQARNPFDDFHPKDVERMREVLAEVRANPGRKITFQVSTRTPNGQYRDIEARAINLLDDPSVGGILVNYWDVTARVEAERNLAQANRFIERVAATIPQALFVVELSTGKSLYRNRHGNQLTDLIDAFFQAPLAGSSARWEIHPDDRQAVEDFRLELHSLDAVRVAGTEFRARRNEGTSWRWLQCQCAQFAQNDQEACTQIVGALNDITPLKESEATLETLVAELEERNSDLLYLAQTLAHDIRNPLLVVECELNELEPLIERGSGAAQVLERIRNTTQRTLKLVDRIRAERCRAVDKAATIPSLRTFVESVVAEQDPLAKKRGVKLTAQVAEGACDLDPVALRQVLTNLIDNAVRSTSDAENGFVRVEATWTQDVLRINVRDNGRGMPPEAIERIFSLYVKLDPNDSGTGVGLALVRKAVETMGGRVWAESEGLNRGACFSMEFPRRSSPDS